MGLITPDFGLFFWMVIAFGLLMLLLGKFAWGPIVKGLSSREQQIARALDRAEEAKAEVARLETQQRAMQAEAQKERDRLVIEARETRDRIVREAREEAQKQAELYLEKSRVALAQQEAEMRRNMRAEVTQIAIQAAERILRERLEGGPAQMEHIDRLLDELLDNGQQPKGRGASR